MSNYTNVKKTSVNLVDKQNLDLAADVMIANDIRLLPQTGIKPSIWCCKWYNTVLTNSNKSTYCYKKGDSVWLNTEDLEDFTKNNQAYIYSVASKNGTLKPLLINAELGGTTELLNFLQKVVTGEECGNAMKQPLYCIGDVHSPTKIRISLSDDNDHLPTDDGWWKDFFVDTSTTKFSDEIYSTFQKTLSTYIQTHIQQYHLSGIELWLREQNDNSSSSLSSTYLLKDFSNTSDFQEYSPYPGTTDSGFDYVVYYHHRHFTGDPKVCKWFRVWKSGYLEHGGIIKNDNTQASYMGDQLTYETTDQDGNTVATHYKVNLGWSYTGGATAPIYSYPTASTGFYYDDESIDIGNGKNIDLDDVGMQLDPEQRYCIKITPFLNTGKTPYSTMRTSSNGAKWYMADEVNTICNNSFRIFLDPDVEYYSYHTSGFAPNSQQGF